MRILKTISLRNKLTLIIMLTSTVALLLACAAFVIFDMVTFRQELSAQVAILADAIGNNCAAAIDFNDPRTAEEALAGLRADAHIISACVYDHTGRVFATYRRDGTAPFTPPAVQPVGETFTSRELRLFRDIEQANVLTGTIFVDSDLNGLESRLLSYAVIVVAVFLTALLAALVLTRQLQRLVTDPILDLAQVARRVAQDKNYAVQAQKQSNDEIGELVDGFNEMLGQIQRRDTALQAARDSLEARVADRTRELQDTHQQLMEASRLGGMAEIATNVLHNIGNVLNSVNISASVVTDSVKKSKLASLAKVVELLREHEAGLGDFLTGDPRGKHLPAYLSQLADSCAADQKATLKELDSLRANIDHIKAIVAMQQTYAKVSGVKEIINLNELVEDSLRMNEVTLNRHQVKVIREFATVPPVLVEKHKVLLVLVNLIRNAKYACDDSASTDKRLTVRVTGENGRIRISVSDNGVGIPAENLTRIFSHGFTTRKDGHGFGLHSGALAAIEMGGSLTVHSDGPGLGATFTLELPGNPKGDAP